MENGEMRENYISEEAELYHELSLLLKKERAQEASAKVLDILKEDISLPDKISRINELDKGWELQKKRTVVTSILAGRNLDLIKRNLKKMGILSFIFIEWMNIRKFAIKTSIIRPNFFNLKINFNKNNWENIRKDASFAEGYLRYILENGWMILDKFDYNLVALSGRLFNSILACNITYFHNAEYILEKLKSVEKYFLACRYRQDYPERIIESITQVLSYFNKADSKIQGITYFIRRLLFQTGEPRSLYNLILAANMICYRQYLSQFDLIRESEEGIISNADFECPEGVKMKIAAFISDNEMRLEQILEEKKSLEKASLFVRQYSSRKPEGRGLAEFEALIVFYDADESNENIRFLVDKDNLLAFCGNFIRRFLGDFEIFLNGKIKVGEKGEIQIFTYDFFVNEIGRMQSLLKSFSSANLASLRINRSRLSEIKKDPHLAGAGREENEVVRFIDELSNILLNIGKKTGHLSLVCKPVESGNLNEQVFQPMDQSLLSKSIIFIPSGDRKIMSPGYLHENTIADAIGSIASICYDMCRYLQNEEVVTYRESEISISEEIRKIRKTLERLADNATFERIKKTYSI